MTSFYKFSDNMVYLLKILSLTLPKLNYWTW